MKRYLALIVAVAVLVLPAVVLGMTSSEYPIEHPVLSIVVGDVTVKSAAASAWDAAGEGMLLNTGDTVKTGPGAKAEISCATGKMRLYENTVIVVPEVVAEGDRKDVRQVNLEEGTGLFRIKKRGVEKGFEVHTRQIIAGVKGTLFAVQATGVGGFSRVLVYFGIVETTNTERDPDTLLRLKRGKAVEVDDSGEGDPAVFNPDDAWGDWQGSSVYEPMGAPWSPARRQKSDWQNLDLNSNEEPEAGSGRAN